MFKVKVISIMQPTYLPWLGYFQLMKNSNIFVILDDVQFEKRSWQQRNRIRNNEKEIILTVPVATKSKYSQRIIDVAIDETQNWQHKHYTTIEHCYNKAFCSKICLPFFKDMYLNRAWCTLLEINLYFIYWTKAMLGLTTKIIKSSDLKTEGTKTERLINLCKTLGATKYLSPLGSRAYLNEKLFSDNNISLEYQSFVHPVYQQCDYPDFISNLSIVDAIMNYDFATINDWI